MKNTITLCLLLAVVAFTIIGCRAEPKPELVKPQYDKPLLPGQSALRLITNPYEIPDFTVASVNLKDLRESIDRSLNYLSKPSSKNYFPIDGITHYRTRQSLETMADLLDSGLRGSALNSAIRDKFDVYMSVGCDDQGTVLFTGYYTPIFDGSQIRSGRFQYPLYEQPADLVKGKDGQILGRRLASGDIVPYPSRSVIENSRMLTGNELYWMSDPFEAYIAHVQGSAKLRMPDGELVTVGYAANNGHEYQSISKKLVEDGVLTSDQLSLAAMIDYFKSHIEQVSRYTQLNPRFVFFRKADGPPRGSLNEPVTAYRTIATDKSIFPRAALTFIVTSLPQETGGTITNQIYSGFTLDQDTGGAIRAPGRCDVYMGTGDNAGRLAGQTYQEGKLYYLFLKPVSMVEDQY